MNPDSLVRLGKLCFEDFLLLEPCGVRTVLADPEARADLAPALANAPDIEQRFREIGPIGHMPAPELADGRAAQARLVRHFALLLLKHKSPPLYDCLPWHDWDFSIVTRSYPLWRTRFLLAGEGTTTLISRLPRTAGVYVIEPLDVIRRYVAQKAQLDGIRRFRVLPQSPIPNPHFLFPIPLPDSSVDLAVVGSGVGPEGDCHPISGGTAIQFPFGGNWWLSRFPLFLRELERVARSVLLVENCPLFPPLPAEVLAARGFEPGAVSVTGLGERPCWHLVARARR